MKEEDIVKKLVLKFPQLANSIKVQRERRLMLEVASSGFTELLEYVIKELGFSFLVMITGLDEGEKLSLIYHMEKEYGTIMNIKTSLPKSDPRTKTITNILPNAEIYEREISDLLGVVFEGLAPGNRYPLTDDWPKDQFPLRKDWKIEEGVTNA